MHPAKCVGIFLLDLLSRRQDSDFIEEIPPFPPVDPILRGDCSFLRKVGKSRNTPTSYRHATYTRTRALTYRHATSRRAMASGTPVRALPRPGGGPSNVSRRPGVGSEHCLVYRSPTLFCRPPRADVTGREKPRGLPAAFQPNAVCSQRCRMFSPSIEHAQDEDGVWVE